MRVSIRRSLFLASLLLVPAAAHAQSEVTSCGRELDAPGDYHLVGDLGPCAGSGIVVTASDVRLTLSGYTITGLGTCEPQIGIEVRGAATNFRVSGGTVTGFETGVSLTSGSRASALRVLDNCGFGIIVAGTGARVDTSLVSGSVDGIALCDSVDAVVTSNDVRGNSRFGVLVSCGQGGNDGNDVVQNIVRENGTTGADGGGIGVFSGNGHLIAGNHLLGNLAGIDIRTSAGTTIEDNTANGNETVGIVLSGGANGATQTIVRENGVHLNGLVDMQDDSADCGTNTWGPNRFVTDIVAGLPDDGPGGGCIR
jgi:parallel beta-helix repeat protein